VAGECTIDLSREMQLPGEMAANKPNEKAGRETTHKSVMKILGNETVRPPESANSRVIRGLSSARSD
jgi:hypothetical protein